MSLVDSIAGRFGFVRKGAPQADLRTPLSLRPPEPIRWDRVLDLAKQKLADRPKVPRDKVFAPAEPPPGVVGKEGAGFAMDDAGAWGAGVGWAGTWAGTAYSEGLTFLGYPLLAEMAQRPEYRRFAEIISTEMTRKWIELEAVGDEGEDPSMGEELTKKIEEITAELERLDCRENFRKAAEGDAYFGRSHLYIDTGATDDDDELEKPIGRGGKASAAKFKNAGKFIKALRYVEATWTYPKDYDTSDPLKGTWYVPTSWWVMAKVVHGTRLLTFIGREIPDLLKPAYSFGGLAMTQMAKPYVDIWLNTRQAVYDIVHAFSIFVLGTDLNSLMQDGGDSFFARLDLFTLCRDNRGVMAINKEQESFENVAAPLGGLAELQSQSQEHMCSVIAIPVVKFLGIQPAGLNASSEGELRSFEDWIEAYQNKLFRQPLSTIVDLIQVGLYGEADARIKIKFVPLRTMDEKALAEVDSIEADADAKRIESGVVSQEEVRKALAAKAGSRYASLDVSDVPGPSPEEMEELGKAAAGFGRGEKGETEAGEQGAGEVARLDRQEAA